MFTLQRTSKRFSDWLKTQDGREFRGTIQPLKEGSVSASTFAEGRYMLHVAVNEPVTAGTVIFDRWNRPFLVGSHDIRRDARSHKLFVMTDYVSWTRSVPQTDLVTGLKKSEQEVELGPIWCAIEIFGREEVDRAVHVGFDRSKVLTGSPIMLNDKIDGRMVRRLFNVFGVWSGEIQ